MPKGLQAKLLRTLQERTVQPVGAAEEQPIDVRVIAATHRNLEQLVREGLFREDLYYRLDVIPIELPPLRERREDIALLAEHFRREFNARDGRAVPGLLARGAAAPDDLRLAGQRPPAGERHRAAGAAGGQPR